jgi:hypothetical protein
LLYFNYPLSRVRKRIGYTTIISLGKERAVSPTLTETGNVTIILKEEML